MNTITSDRHPPRTPPEERFIFALLKLASAWNATLTLNSRSRFLPLLSMRHNIESLKKIPILHVAQKLGIEVVKTGTGTYAMREEKQITSLILFEKNNSWHRFSGREQSGVSRGSTIDLVMHVRDCSLREAIDFLSSRFL